MSIAEDLGALSEEEQAAHVSRTEAAMAEAGVALTEDVGEIDYFAFDVEHIVNIGGGQWVSHREFNEGARKKYLNMQNRDMIVQKATGDMKVKMAPGDERHALLKAAICGWEIYRGKGENRQAVPFTARNLDDMLDKFPPKIIDIIEKDVRKNNPWLLSEMSVEDIDKEIASLQEMREAKIKEEEGNVVSSNK